MLSPPVQNALKIAAQQMGENNYRSQRASHLKAGRRIGTFRYTTTPEHRAILAAMMNKDMDDDKAMALLQDPNIVKQLSGEQGN